MAAEAERWAAVVIQSAWRGHWLRKRMGLVRENAAFIDADDDFDYDEVCVRAASLPQHHHCSVTRCLV